MNIIFQNIWIMSQDFQCRYLFEWGEKSCTENVRDDVACVWGCKIILGISCPSLSVYSVLSETLWQKASWAFSDWIWTQHLLLTSGDVLTISTSKLGSGKCLIRILHGSRYCKQIFTKRHRFVESTKYTVLINTLGRARNFQLKLKLLFPWNKMAVSKETSWE